MANASTRLALAVLALAVIWVVAYWRTEAPAPRPSVAFGEPPVERASQEQPDNEPVAAAPVNDPNLVETVLPPPKPAPQETPSIPGGTIPPRFRDHTVARGDTAESLSQRYYGTPARWDAVMRANPRIDFHRLRAGTIIKIALDPDNIQGVPAPVTAETPAVPSEPPPPIEYRVKPGDTLSDIARAVYGQSSLWTIIRDANIDKVGRDGTRLRAGTTIIIPPLAGQGAQR